jgi:hypothetical protein
LRSFRFLLVILVLSLLCGCAAPAVSGGVAATTGPVAQFAAAIADATFVNCTVEDTIKGENKMGIAKGGAFLV